MSKGNTTETDLLAKVFTATALPWDAATDLDIHLHTADPGEAGASTASECSYTGYAPVTVSRSASAWTVTGNTATNDNQIQFGACTAGSNVATYFSVTVDAGTQILYSGALSASLSITAGITPLFEAGSLTITED